MRGSSNRLLAVALGCLAFAPGAAWAQPAPYLKGTRPWFENTTGISGLWDQQNYASSSTNPPRRR